jgi:hypothetical protein
VSATNIVVLRIRCSGDYLKLAGEIRLEVSSFPREKSELDERKLAIDGLRYVRELKV